MLSRIARLRLRRLAIAASALLVCLSVPGAGLLAEQPRSMPPRFRLKLGQELIYRVTASGDLRDSNGEKNASGNALRERSQWQLTVVRENDDGSWRLFIRSEQAFLNPDGSERRKFDSFDYCDLRPDGSYSLNEQTAMFKMLVIVPFGETVDDDIAVPRHASSKAYRGFRHVEAKEIYDLYQLQQYGFGTPSTLVLDQNGRIREAFSGYAADLGQCVRSVVDELRGDGKDPR